MFYYIFVFFVLGYGDVILKGQTTQCSGDGLEVSQPFYQQPAINQLWLAVWLGLPPTNYRRQGLGAETLRTQEAELNVCLQDGVVDVSL